MSATDTLSATLSAITTAVTSVATATASTPAGDSKKNVTDKVIGVSLALGSGILIGSSFVIKKKGLLAATRKAGTVAGEGHAYLRNWLWWLGMIMMIVGEICNFVAFAFTEALLITPLGAITIVVCAILSKFFLNESLTFFGWMGCILCILGASILALNAPETQSVSTVPQLQKLWVSPGFLTWAGICIVASGVLAFYFGPRYGKKNMFVYITICSLIGGLSVSTLQGVGAAIMTSIRGDNQFKHWFLYVVTAFTVVTLLTEINYLNKALELFNTSMVTPTYYIIFTTCTMISSFILYQGLKASAVSLITMVLGFLVTCFGITVLQMSKVDPKHFDKLDRRSTMLLAASRNPTEDDEKQEIVAMEQPGMDALRSGFGAVGSIIRARSVRRMSSMSSMPGRSDSQHRPFPANSPYAGMQRYQLTDPPVHDDPSDEISLKSRASGNVSNGNRRPTLKFDEQEIVHQYDRKGHEHAIHTSRTHNANGEIEYGAQRTTSPMLNYSKSPTEEKTGHSFFGARPFKTFRRQTSGTADEESGLRGDDLANVPLTPTVTAPHGILESTVHVEPPLMTNRSALDPSHIRPSFHTLLNRLTSSDGPDLRLHSGSRRGSVATVKEREEVADPVRGGNRRGTKDYPHLKKSAADQEQEERRALVTDDVERDEDESGPEAQETDEEEGMVSPFGVEAEVIGVRRLPNIPRDGATYPPPQR
ncbi:hypothetical protein NliqN6_1420 [Naganishia liquefaciens]|uniref:DUF803-domain-containing protein n=1 Tax=Naganishia liquefaciens TaxID=104408 RepID=A0A8H3TPZ2_9TREE|nr:hypothetical protein NliqN6_1420 [Naganishia liquefaciens]